MMFFSFAVFFLVAALQFHTDSATGTAKCPPNSQYRKVDTCETRCDHLPPMTKDCRDGKPEWRCGCNEGYLAQSRKFDKKLECVKPKDCKAKCGENAHYDPSGSPCQPICGNPDLPKMCKGIPGPRCICNSRYIMDEKKENNECVKPKHCSRKPMHHP